MPQHIAPDPMSTRARIVTAPHGASGAGTRTPIRRVSDGFVAYDPFSTDKNQDKVERMPNDITFDDIAIADVTGFPVLSDSAAFRSGRSEFQTGYLPQSSQYQSSQQGLYQTLQPTGSYQASQHMGPYQPPTSQASQWMASSTSQPLESFQISHTRQSSQSNFQSQPTTHQTHQLRVVSQIPLSNKWKYHTVHTPASAGSSMHQNPSRSGPDQQPSQPNSATQTPWISVGKQQHTQTSGPSSSIRPLPVLPMTQGETPESSLRNAGPIHTSISDIPQVPVIERRPVKFESVASQATPPTDYIVPWKGDNRLPVSAPSLQQAAPHVSQPAINDSAQFQSWEYDPYASEKIEAAELWPEYVMTDYRYPPESFFDLTSGVTSSFWSRIGDFFRWPFVWMRREDESDEVYYSTITYPYETEGYAEIAGRFVLNTLPKTVYIYFLFRLPSFYFGRVARIFEEADLTLPELKKMALEMAGHGMGHGMGQGPVGSFRMMEEGMLPPQYQRLTATWHSFIDDVMREWQTFNIISVLLLSAILSILSNSAAAEDPVTRYSALCSLICALISLLFGCMYIVRFGSMRKPYKAAEWALEAKKTQRFIFWNVWVLLALPVVWLSWSILLFLLCIMSFIWRASPMQIGPLPTLSDRCLLAIRLVLTFIITLGISYGTLVLLTFSRYGEEMDKAWKRRISRWIDERSASFVVPKTTYNSTGSHTPAQYQASQEVYLA